MLAATLPSKNFISFIAYARTSKPTLCYLVLMTYSLSSGGECYFVRELAWEVEFNDGILFSPLQKKLAKEDLDSIFTDIRSLPIDWMKAAPSRSGAGIRDAMSCIANREL